MTTTMDRLLYVGTDQDAFRVAVNGDHYEPRSLGLKGRGGVQALLVDVRDPTRLYAGTTADGVYRSDDSGMTWREASRGITYRNIYSLAQHPTTGELYVGTEPSNLYRSVDRGESWT